VPTRADMLSWMSGAVGLATLASSAMLTVEEELRVAKAAKSALNVLLTATFKSARVATLRGAIHAAISNLSSGGPLNETRTNIGIALSNLIHGQPTPEKIEKAKGAIEEWINQLRK
jgi:hypothetical protein